MPAMAAQRMANPLMPKATMVVPCRHGRPALLQGSSRHCVFPFPLLGTAGTRASLPIPVCTRLPLQPHAPHNLMQALAFAPQELTHVTDDRSAPERPRTEPEIIPPD